jgi:hypothetical protein
MAKAQIALDADVLAAFGLIVIVFAMAGAAHAQTFKVLHTFDGNNGGLPQGLLVRDVKGNLYGTATVGGANKCLPSTYDCGAISKLSNAAKQLWLYSF